jgi:Vitamin K-dependent gamma-carboxylase
MTAVARLVERIVRPEAPAERLGALRVLVGLFAVIYLLIRTVAMVSEPHQAAFRPAGVAKLLSAPVPGWVLIVSFVLTIATGLCFTAGYRFRATGPAFAALLLWTLSYRNSFGMIWHTENLIVMHVAILAFSGAARAVSLDACRAPGEAAPSKSFGATIQLINLVTVLAYVLAGVAKLRVSGLDWTNGDILRNHVAYDNLRKLLLGDSYSPLGAWAARHVWLFKPFAALTIVVELAAPVALYGGRLAKLWVLAIWSFHAGVLALMWILFPYQLSLVAFAGFFHTERLFPTAFARLRRLFQRVRGLVRS